MLSKFLKTYIILLALSIAANYGLLVAFPSLAEPAVSLLHTLFWVATILLIPFVVGLAISASYKLLKRTPYKYYWQSVWVLWVVIYLVPFVGMYVLQS